MNACFWLWLIKKTRARKIHFNHIDENANLSRSLILSNSFFDQDLKDKKEDVTKMKDYCKVSMDHLHKKQEECASQTKKLSDLDRKKNILKNSVAEMDKYCREEKGVNPDEASGLEYIVHELERQVAQKKKALEEASAVLWKTEQALSK
jgi:hypothetical protein